MDIMLLPFYHTSDQSHIFQSAVSPRSSAKFEGGAGSSGACTRYNISGLTLA